MELKWGDFRLFLCVSTHGSLQNEVRTAKTWDSSNPLSWVMQRAISAIGRSRFGNTFLIRLLLYVMKQPSIDWLIDWLIILMRLTSAFDHSPALNLFRLGAWIQLTYFLSLYIISVFFLHFAMDRFFCFIQFPKHRRGGEGKIIFEGLAYYSNLFITLKSIMKLN